MQLTPNSKFTLLNRPTISENFSSTGRKKTESTVKQAMNAPVNDYTKNMLNTISNYCVTLMTSGFSSIPSGNGLIGTF